MAVAAAELLEQDRLGGSRGSNTKACMYVAKALLTSGCERLKRRFLRSQNTACPRDASSELLMMLGLSETIRRQVSRYRKQHTNWRRDFDFQLQSFRGTYLRDPEWYDEMEPRYVQWLQDFEKRQEFEWFEAGKIVGMARFYHEQHKFGQASTIYRKAFSIARKAFMTEGLREVVLRWLRNSVKACLRKAPILPDPVFHGPRATPPISNSFDHKKQIVLPPSVKSFQLQYRLYSTI
jgi:hypothetical protein